MSSGRSLQILVVAGLLGAPVAALAAPAPAQTHHCKLADGTMDLKKTHKQCTTAKGTWAKDAPAPTAAKAGAATPAKPAPAPTK